MSRHKRYCLLALGSRGDVQPFVALALGLRARGHSVVIAAAADYRNVVEERGIPFAPLVGRIADLMDRPAVANAIDGGPLASVRLGLRLRAQIAPLMNALFADTLHAAQNCDVLVASTLGLHVAYSVAEKLNGVPVVPAHFHPVAPSRFYRNMFFSSGPNNAFYNRLTHFLGVNGFWHLLRPLLNTARRRVLDLPPQSPLGLEKWLRETQQTGRELYGYSAVLAPPPHDWNPDRHVVTGFWQSPLPQDFEQIPDALQAFLDAGEPPVYIGFGSILAGRDPDAVTRVFVGALEDAGMRGVLYRGWGDVGNIALPPTVFATDSVPHASLFPRCRAVVHHGGAGTMAAALRAGVPAIVVSAFGDQHFWARRLHEMGASPAPLPRSWLTRRALADAIRKAVSDADLRRHTQELGAVLQTENGVQNAIDRLEMWTEAPLPPNNGGFLNEPTNTNDGCGHWRWCFQNPPLLGGRGA